MVTMALDQTILFLDEDKLGTSINNKIVGEIHELGEGHNIIKPHMTAYYSKTLKVYAIDIDDSETLLVSGTDYKPTDMFEELTALVGQEICGSVSLLRLITQRKFKLEYQSIGGNQFGNNMAIAGVISDALKRESIDWKDVIGKPSGFPPAPHQVDWKDIYGAEYLVNQINELASAIENSKNIYELGIVDQIRRVSEEFKINYSKLISNTNNIRSYRWLIQGLTSQTGYFKNFAKDYYAFYFNKELATILEFIVNDKYSKLPNYNDLYPVPEHTDGLELWIDFSDTSKQTIVSGKISSITDKSSKARVFSQSNDVNRPLSIDNPNYGFDEINRNKSANFTTNTNLVQTSGPVFKITEEFTIVILSRVKTTPGTVLGHNANTDKLSINDDQFRAINLFSQKYLIKSTTNTVTNNKTLLNFLSVGDTNKSLIWNVNTFGNVGSNVYGLSQFTENVSIPELVFNMIGNNASTSQNYEVAEILVYNRQLSLVEAVAIKEYLSRKWTGEFDLNIDMNIESLETSDPTPENFWLYLDTNTP